MCKAVQMSNVCSRQFKLPKEDFFTFQDFIDDKTDKPSLLCKDENTELYTKLLQYRSDLMSTEPASALVGPGILYGLTDTTVKSIVKNSLRKQS